ncbi:hypothetical protein N2152v2_004823 [Parachlorella kessleri]
MEEAVWESKDWQWDPIAMVANRAKPAESKMRAAKLAAAAAAAVSQDKSHSSGASESEHRGQRGGCQVDNCTADLSTMREYHQRYKICEFHLKAHSVTKDGRQQRFCQQCGKFQPKEDFDADKRSCRARLEKHNARRRRQREVAHLLKKGVKVDPKRVDRGDGQEWVWIRGLACGGASPAVPCCRPALYNAWTLFAAAAPRASTRGSQPWTGAMLRLWQLLWAGHAWRLDGTCHDLTCLGFFLEPPPGSLLPPGTPAATWHACRGPSVHLVQAVLEQYHLGEDELASKAARLQEQGFTVDLAAAPVAPSPAPATVASATTGAAQHTSRRATPINPAEEAAFQAAATPFAPDAGATAFLASAAVGLLQEAPAPAGPGGALSELLASDLGLLDDEFLEAMLQHPGMLPAVQQAQHLPAPPAVFPAEFLQVDPSQLMDLDDMAILGEISQEYSGLLHMHAALAPAASAASDMASSMALPPGLGLVGPPPLSAAPPGYYPPTPSDDFSRPPFGLLPASQQQQQAAAAQGVPAYLALPTQGSLASSAGSAVVGEGRQGSVGGPARAAAGAMGDPAMSLIDEALNLLAYDAAQVGSAGWASAPAPSGRVVNSCLHVLVDRAARAWGLMDGLRTRGTDVMRDQVTYIPEDRLFRFSAKLFNCTPDQLPEDLKASLMNMLTCNSLEGYIKPGCVHVTVDALMGPEEREAMAAHDVRGVVERLVAQQPEAFWAQHTMLVQLGDKMALVREGQVVHVLATAAGATQVFPRLSAVRPLVAAPEPDGATLVTLWGYNLAGGEESDVVLARSQGKYVGVERVGEVVSDPSWGGLQRLQVRVAGAELGALQLEIMRGGFISSSKTLLVHVDPQLATELRQLENDATGMDIDTTLFELGRVVEYGSGGRSLAAWGPEERAKAGKAARRMLAFAIQRKWVGVTRALLASISADCRPLDAVAAADVMAAGTTGMPLLQLAVRTQSKELVAALLAWGRAKGYSFKATTPGRRGLTALHLAALIRDQGVIAGMITELCDDAVSGWEAAAAEDGTTPMAFAQAHGNADIIRHLIAAKQLKKARLIKSLALGQQSPARAAQPASPFALGGPLDAASLPSAANFQQARGPGTHQGAGAGNGALPRPDAGPVLAAAAAAAAAGGSPAPSSLAAALAQAAQHAAAGSAAGAGFGREAAPSAPGSPLKSHRGIGHHPEDSCREDGATTPRGAAGANSNPPCAANGSPSSSADYRLHDSVKSIGDPAACSKGGVGACKAHLEASIAAQEVSFATSEAGFGEPGAFKGPLEGEGEYEEEDEVARQKAESKRRRRAMHAATSTLAFRDAALEAKYAKWYHSGQVPVDVAFIVIAVLSQGAWIFRWSMEHSALGLCMVALMALNAALIHVACLFPSTYRQYRELLCLLSHALHKLVQLLVTATPPVGTLYSPTFNSTVAVLESSSFAQIMMLSFGVKMRFAFHVFVNLFHLGVSAAINDRICSSAWPHVPGGLCYAGLLAFQFGACFLLPCTLVYLTERRSRRLFLETVVD